MPDAITQTVPKWREFLCNVQRQYIALSERSEDFFVVFVEDSRSERIHWPGPPMRVLKYLFPFGSSFRLQNSMLSQPHPISMCYLREGKLYFYRDRDGYREWRDISESMIPLLSNPPPGVTWPGQTTIVTSTTWLFTLLKFGLASPGFPLFIARHTTELHAADWTHPITSALNLRLAGVHGITVLLNAEPDVPATPHYDSVQRELWVGSELVKKLRRKSSNQECVLLGFEEDKWPSQIDDPLPPRKGKKGNKASASATLRETVRALNERQVYRRVIFTADGNEGISWTIGPRLK